MKRLTLLGLVLGALLVAALPDQPPRPDDTRFTPVVLTAEGALDEPMAFDLLPDGTALIAERKGALKKYNSLTREVSVITRFPVFIHNEQGFVGISLDPNFTRNHWVYVYLAHPTESKFQLVRWTLLNDKLVAGSQQVVLEIPVDRDETSHTGGGMVWDSAGNLYLTVGNNSGNSYTAQTDERPGRSRWDDQRTSANTNDLRGKILRIHPEPDGSYTIPDGNLFPKGTPKTRPEIYVMGTRNAWRPFLDSRTGWLYWGEIGPDADQDTENAPRGYDEFNQAKGPGFFGWPYFVGENQAYPIYDFAAKKPGAKLDPARPVNRSVNNTGLTDLPPAQPALIAYPYAVSEKYPLLGSSSRAAIGGPIYHRADFKAPKRPFPAYYEGKWLAADLSRFWIMAFEFDVDGNLRGMERFAPHYHPRQPIDLRFGADGDLYVLEYGGSTSLSAKEARLVRIEYNAGNRKPLVQARADRSGGALPFTARLSAEGTKDFDGDALTYQWTITGAGQPPRVFRTPNPAVRFDRAGVYTATLTVTDAKGAKNSQPLRLVAGNEPPVVALELSGNRQFFFPNQELPYRVSVADREDGSLADSRIRPEQVAISVDYVSEGFDWVDAGMNQQRVDASTQFAVAKTMMSRSDCGNCHALSAPGVGPAYQQIAARYRTDGAASERLAAKIRSGGAGVWGETAMPAHPTLSLADARTLVRYILNSDTKTLSTLPVEGRYRMAIPADDNGRGTYILRAAYTDRQTRVPAQTTEQVIILRRPELRPAEADILAGGAVRDQLDEFTFLTAKAGSHIGFKAVDLTDVRSLTFRPNWHLYDIYRGGTVEVRLDAPTGPLLGRTEIAESQFNIKKMPGGMDAFWGREPRNDKNAKTTPSTLAIQPVSGRHDLYFVFTSQQAKPGESLFPLASVTLSNQTP